ncbi:MAG: transporter substrate-binding domain-containing protein [Fimbriimonadales bacterium]|nr:transporter substrate-binding domain-containing protein [Fimbriimonadales bacterium]
MRGGVALVGLGMLGLTLCLAGCPQAGPTEDGAEGRPLPNAQQPSSERRLLFAGNAWWPYTGESHDGRQGFTVDLVRAALRRMGFEMDYVVRPWSRVVRELEAGRIDGTTCACSGPERPWHFTRANVGLGPGWVSGVTVLRSKASRWRWRGPDSLRTARLALVANYHYPSPLRERLARPDRRLVVVTGEDPTRRLVALAAKGTVDAIADDRLVLQATLARMPAEAARLEEVGFLPACNLKAAFSPRLPDGARLARELDRAMREVYRSPEFPLILSRYGLRPEP